MVVSRAALIAIIAIGLGGAPAANAGTQAEWDALASSFIDAVFALDPTAAIVAGRHEYDGAVTDASARGIDARAQSFRTWMARGKAFDATGLSERTQLERDLLIWYCDSRLFWIESARRARRNPTSYWGYFSPTVYITREYAPLADRMRALTKHLSHTEETLAAMRENLERPLPRVFVEQAIQFFAGMASYFEHDVPVVFQSVQDPALQRAFATANTSAIAAFRGAEAEYRGQLDGATDAFALGEALFAEMLRRTELVDEALPALTARNRADLARNRAALDTACRTIDKSLTTAQCVARVAAQKPADGPVARGAAQLADLKRFVVEHDLMSVPLPDEALVHEAPPYQRTNLAYIEIPGPYEKPGLPSIYYIAPPDPGWSQEEQRAYIPGEPALLFTSAHEVWPGHFMHGLHMRAHAGTLGRLFLSTAFTEGWAHYAEEMMWDAGLGSGDPTIHVGQLTMALWRNVRFASAIGLHTGSMTLAESERMFKEDAFLDPGNARQQAARGAYDPAYLAYTLGKLQILDLRERWTASRGGRTAWKAFHDALLSFGAPPVPLAAKYLPK